MGSGEARNKLRPHTSIRFLAVLSLAVSCFFSAAVHAQGNACTDAASPGKPFLDMLSRINSSAGVIPTAPGSGFDAAKGKLSKAEDTINKALKACDVASRFGQCMNGGRGLEACARAGVEDSLCAYGELIGLDGANPFSLLQAWGGGGAAGTMGQTLKVFNWASGDASMTFGPSFNPLCRNSAAELFSMGNLVCGKPSSNTSMTSRHTEGFAGGCPTCFDPDKTENNWTQPICQPPGDRILGPALRPSNSPDGASCKHFKQCNATPPGSSTDVEKAARFNEAFTSLREAFKGERASPSQYCSIPDLIDLGSFRGL